MRKKIGMFRQRVLMISEIYKNDIEKFNKKFSGTEKALLIKLI